MILPPEAAGWDHWRHRVNIKHYFNKGGHDHVGPGTGAHLSPDIRGGWMAARIRIHMLISRAAGLLKCFPGDINNK